MGQNEQAWQDRGRSNKISRRNDLEASIIRSYNLLRDFEKILPISLDPKEQQRCREGIEEQRELIHDWLIEYLRLQGDIPTHIAEIATALGLVQAFYEDGAHKYAARQLCAAQEAFRTVVKVAGDYREAQALLDDVRQRLAKLGPIYEAGIQDYEARRLCAALETFQAVVDVAADYREAQKLRDDVRQQLASVESTYVKGKNDYKDGRLWAARRAFRQVRREAADYQAEDVARRLREVERLLLKRVLWVAAPIAVALFLAAATIIVGPPKMIAFLSPPAPTPPPACLDGAQVRFQVTFADSHTQTLSPGDVLTLAPGAGILLYTEVTANQAPVPCALSFQYTAPAGTTPQGNATARTSYVAPEEAGPDLIVVVITDKETWRQMTGSIHVVVQAALP